MNGRHAFIAVASALLLTAAIGACVFNPSWEAYVPCGEDGACPAGTLCWTPQQVCLPACGEGPCPDAGVPDDPDAGIQPDAGDGGMDADAGEEPDAGDEPDAGSTEDGGETPDAGPLRLDARVLPPAIETEPYAEAISPRGGVPPYVLEQTGGELPAGLALDGGVVEGMPTMPGAYTFTLRASDDGAPPSTDDAQFDLEVVPLLRIASQSKLTDAHAGHPYEEQLQALGGSGGALLWTVSDGAPPSGLTLNSTGLISGTTSAGATTFEVTLTDMGSGAQVRKQQMSIGVINLGVTLHMRSQSLPHGQAGTPYEYKLVAGGGSPPYTWSIKDGALGNGLFLQGDTVVGTPTTPGDYTVTIEVMEALLSARVSRTFTFTVH